MGTGSFLGVKSGRGVTLTPHPFYCRGQDRVELYLYSPYGPYGLYKGALYHFTLTYQFFFIIRVYQDWKIVLGILAWKKCCESMACCSLYSKLMWQELYWN
jgi:hypothetical protein